ncbi:phytanoyl-CoA dioxygenase family protein [Paenibacillus chartarius]|uniref:Phytanoyl-CoA dioxygenase family protein n=1 Tax=Paenibacillus chartarius TaxID=747481 RepID=A0ABV6DL36_9BACL
MTGKLNALTPEQKDQFDTEGYLIVRGLLTAEEVNEIKDTFEQISHTTVPGYFEPDLSADNTDPLKRYPRIVHPHRFNDVAMKYMLHPKVMAVMEDLYQEEALAAQSMFYYKPPGSRGQALHQDNFYLKVEPGNCIAAWAAIDPADEENGGMLIVPKTQQFDIVCPEEADPSQSFTTHLVKPPKDRAPVPAIMEAGDILFFNGNMIHGSYRNKSKDRFRRAFICHYANASASMIGKYYRPLYRANGEPVDLPENQDGGPCGIEFTAPYGAH